MSTCRNKDSSGLFNNPDMQTSTVRNTNLFIENDINGITFKVHNLQELSFFNTLFKAAPPQMALPPQTQTGGATGMMAAPTRVYADIHVRIRINSL